MEIESIVSVENLARVNGISGMPLSTAVYAFYMDNALEVIRILESEVLPVAQVNAYSMNSNGPYFQGSLCCDYKEGESWSDYTKRSYKESISFIMAMEGARANHFGYVFTTFQP